ncbi:MAG: cytochrome C [Acidobacteria bacterium]|nr:MAG: cytochrome C [Acidobacteriota bacterium]
MTDYITRFSLRQRVEHASVGLLFIVLATTGLIQEFFPMRWAGWMILEMGGIDRVRWIHRVAGIGLAFVVFSHVIVSVLQVVRGQSKPTMVPTRKDFDDVVIVTRYYLQLSDEQPRFDRYDFRQKLEYWGLIFGSLIMTVTGFMLYFPVLTTRFLPGEVIPAALIAHGREGLLAFLVIITWHFFNSHLSPEAFPIDTSIFTGKISRERMEKEHPLEYERVLASGEGKLEGPGPGESRGPG